jgi:hypothetical protein
MQRRNKTIDRIKGIFIVVRHAARIKTMAVDRIYRYVTVKDESTVNEISCDITGKYGWRSGEGARFPTT